MKNISLQIKHIMLDKDMTQDDLAKKMDTTRQNISRMLSGKDFKISTLEAIADALDCDLHIDIIPR